LSQIQITEKPLGQFKLRRRPRSEKLVDRTFQDFVLVMSSMVFIILAGILILIILGSLESINNFGLKFIYTSNWNPVTNEYGALNSIYGTLFTSIAALFIAVPLGVGTAILITESFIPISIRNLVSLMVELLAAIPSVVLGLWAIFVMEPLIRPLLILIHKLFFWIPLFSTEPVGPSTAPSVLIIVVMILPIITSISRDSLKQVPRQLKEAAYGIGATKWSSIINITLPAAISGIVAGVLLALGRAMGETMAVTMIIGNSLNFNWSIFSPGNTIAAMIANQFGEADGGQVSSLMYAALILMILTLSVNILAQFAVKKLSLKY
tara:strand:- start:2068 stop:3033 length:966 start_codon:yes stop_codon:yes gene_type:complete